MPNRRSLNRKRRYEGHKGEEQLKEEKEKGESEKKEGGVGRTKTMEESRIEEGEVGKEKTKKRKIDNKVSKSLNSAPVAWDQKIKRTKLGMDYIIFLTCKPNKKRYPFDLLLAKVNCFQTHLK